MKKKMYRFGTMMKFDLLGFFFVKGDGLIFLVA